MNCMDARREILAQPFRYGADLRAHVSQCHACDAFSDRMRTMEQSIAQALAVPVPGSMAPAILELYAGGIQRGRRRLLAMAASLGALALGAGLTTAIARDDPEALAGIDFVVDEEANAILAAAPPDPAALRRAVEALEIQLPSQLGYMRYIGTCPYEGTIAHHVIAATPYGKVTLLLVPDRRIDGRKSASTRGLRAVVVPAGAGCLTVVADSARSVHRAVDMVLRG